MPPLLEDEPVAPPPPRHRFGRRSTRRTLIGFAWRLLIFALVIGFLWSGWYLARKGFGRQWRNQLVEELHKRGVEISLRRLTLDPFRGLIARDVRIFDDKHRETTLALISEISLDINYAALLHRQPFLNGIDIRDANISFPLPAHQNAQAEKAQLSHFRAHIYFPPEQIYVSQAEGVFCGVRISAAGQLIKRENYQPSSETSAAEWQARLQLLQNIVAQLNQLRFPAGAPLLQVKFTGDLSQLEDARFEARLQGRRIVRTNYELRNLNATAEWSEQKLNLTQCEWSDALGHFAGRAAWSRQTGVADFGVQSTIDLRAFLDAFGLGEPLRDFHFLGAPSIELSGHLPLDDANSDRSVIGRAIFERFTYRTVPFDKLRADFSWDGNRTMLRGVRLQQGSDELRADLLDAPNDFRLNIDSAVDPAPLGALAPADLQKFLGEWQWSRPPTIRLNIQGASRNPATWSGDGNIVAGRTRFRGVAMESATADLHFAKGVTTIDNLRVTREEGVGTGSFTYDSVEHEIRIKNVRTHLRPSEAIYWIEPKLAKEVVPYKFHQPPSLTANGVIRLHGRKGDHLEINVEAPKGMDYLFLGKTLVFDKINGKLLFTDNRLQLSDVAGSLFTGAIRGTADISLAKNDQRYRANLAFEGIDFPSLTNLYFKFGSAKGRLRGSYDFSGVGDHARAMAGTGKIHVTDGDVFAIPVFGPLSELVSKIIPGTGYSVAHDANASFAIKDGVAHTDDFKVNGRLFSLLGHGDIRFVEDQLDFDVRINANVPGGVLLTPMYKLFEYTGTGSLSKPVWRAKHL